MHSSFVTFVNDMYVLYIWDIWQEQGAGQMVQNERSRQRE